MTTHSRPQEHRIPTQRRQAARWQRERRRRRWVLVFAAVVLLVVVAIPAYGYYNSFIAPPRTTIATVGGIKHSLGELVKRTRANAITAVSLGQAPELGTLPFQMLINMVNEELIRQATPELGVVVTQDDVDAEIRDRHYPDILEGQQPDPEAAEREFQEIYRRFLNLAQFSDREYREMVRVSLLRTEIRELMSDQVPAVEEQVYAHWLRVADEETLVTVQGEVDNGKSLDQLARIYSIGGPYADDDGVVGWVPRGAFPDLDDELFSVEHDVISGPIISTQGVYYYFVKVTDGPELLEVSDEMREVLKTRIFEKWLNDERESGAVSVNFTSYEYEWVVNKVQEALAASTSG
ncbi:MAG: SurA N-terminal domain-containing protein [Dehalococcoidia bacterium]